MKRPSTMLHFHNGHSLEVWCGRRSALANWTTVAAWVTCRACRQMIESRMSADAVDPHVTSTGNPSTRD